MRRTKRPPRGAGPAASRTPPTVGLVILSRHYREALARALKSRALLVADLGDGTPERILERLLDLGPEVALIDLPPSEAAMLIRETYRAAPAIRTIALNQGGDERAAVALFETGVTGYIHRSSSIEDVRAAIRDTLVGELHCPPRITAALVRRLNEVGKQRKTRATGTSVSPKEAQVLPLLEQGLTNKEIAQRLSVEESTIKNHVHNILRKFGVHQRSEAVRRYRDEAPI
jgi:two-component system, NarL family, nitrate/nitrite response regulator NarL